MFLAALGRVNGGRFLRQPVGEVGIEPVAPFGADTQIATRFAIDPTRKVDPLVDFVGRLRYQGTYSLTWPLDSVV